MAVLDAQIFPAFADIEAVFMRGDGPALIGVLAMRR
jgi:hypothetical protein